MTMKKKPKNAAAVELGRRGAAVRYAAMTDAQRQELGRRAAAIRWSRERAKTKRGA